jgi:hypothetical protein
MTNLTCILCANFIGGNICEAFKNGIAEEIVNGKSDHLEPIKGQENDIVFEEIK